MSETLLAQIGQQFTGAEKILLATHLRPDGDAVGSVLGLGMALQSRGKSVCMVFPEGLPSNFRHLHGVDQVRRKVNFQPDLITVLDCSDLHRVGNVLEGLDAPIINIDHHITNEYFGSLNLVDTDSVAVAAMLAEHMPSVGLLLTKEIADVLLTGILTDTLGFRTQNMNPKALRISASLVDMGANLPELYTRALVNRSFEAVCYWGAGLSQLKREDGLVWTTLSLDDRKTANYPGNDDADLVNIISMINKANIAIIFVEQHNGKVKVSWRAQEGIDVSQISTQFGGGGHISASGAMIEGDLEHVRATVLQATRTLIEGTLKKI
jgi:phosphoesterase RecJ-like protein